ncbi:MAG: PEP-CTERM sorting domain-containing protein, partial [Bryobacterales bacterium]
GIAVQSLSTTSLGSFKVTLPATYTSGSGFMYDVAISQDSFLGTSGFQFAGDTAVATDDDGCCHAAFVVLDSLLDVSFVTDSALDMELLIGNVGGTCGADGCMRFELRDTSTDTLIFGTSGYYLAFADGRGVDLFDYDPTVGIPVSLPAGSYSFFARTGAQWHSRERTASGEALAVSLAIVPEPGTATLMALGLVSIAVRRRRDLAHLASTSRA